MIAIAFKSFFIYLLKKVRRFELISKKLSVTFYRLKETEKIYLLRMLY